MLWFPEDPQIKIWSLGGVEVMTTTVAMAVEVMFTPKRLGYKRLGYI
jgi:hypothetical protein